MKEQHLLGILGRLGAKTSAYEVSFVDVCTMVYHTTMWEVRVGVDLDEGNSDYIVALSQDYDLTESDGCYKSPSGAQH